MIGHGRWKRLVGQLADGECGGAEESALRKHLSACADCRADYGFQMKLRNLSANPPDARNPSDYFEQKLAARIASGRFEPAFLPAGNPAFAVLTALVLILIISLTGIGSYALELDGLTLPERVRVLSTAAGSVKPSVLNLAVIHKACFSCHEAVCRGCSRCGSDGKPDSCCPGGEVSP